MATKKRKNFIPTDNLCKCGNPGTYDHTCPYRVQINDDSASKCNCCDSCQSNCAEDV